MLGGREHTCEMTALLAERVRVAESENAALRKRVEELEHSITAHHAAHVMRRQPGDVCPVCSPNTPMPQKYGDEVPKSADLADLCQAAVARAENAEARVREYEGKLSTEMPKDMKDWWENSKEEWPEIARWVLENRRKRMEQDERELDYEQERNRLNVQQWSEENAKLQADLDALRATSAELDADRLRKHEELHRVKADLDAALLVCTVLGVQYGRAWLSEEARKAGEHVAVLLEKRRVERG